MVVGGFFCMMPPPDFTAWKNDAIYIQHFFMLLPDLTCRYKLIYFPYTLRSNS